MILPLRRRHRRVFAVLGVLLPSVLALGIAGRRKVPHVATLAPELATWTQAFTATDDERGDLFVNSPVRVRFWREQGTGRVAVGFAAPTDFLIPDLLAYWAGAPPRGDTVTPDAKLLGAFAASPLVLPAEAIATPGHLILFSLADQTMVDVSKALAVPATDTALGSGTRSDRNAPRSETPRLGNPASN
jgi:hypothetical protein